MPPTLVLERRAWAAGRLLVGIDEVGRGPLAGPVVAAAVVFPAGWAPPRGIRDSKQLSPRQRAALVPRLRDGALAIGVGAASVREIDRLNIRVATALAMRRALARVLARHAGALVVVDGLPVPELGHEHEALVRGDAHCPSIAAAGIVAKQLRDGLMARLARRHPGYAWEANMGYGSAAHLASLAVEGPCAHHRHSFAPVALAERRMA
ncbi:MAG: ribonuclease HII [Gemmatimonadales bacterium]|nr:ribonuclease HII [Gemmatimonadales bacterium]